MSLVESTKIITKQCKYCGEDFEVYACYVRRDGHPFCGIDCAIKGKRHWNKGLTKETDRKLEIISQKISENTQGRIPWNKGLTKDTHKTLKRLSIMHTGRKNPCWRGGLTPLTRIIRNSVIYKVWQKAVFIRDKWQCQCCGNIGGKLHAHHIKPFTQILQENEIVSLGQAIRTEVLWEIDNGITLCKKCHNVRHSKMKEAELIDRESWYSFECLLPPKVFDLLETELERIRLLADIDPDDKLPQIVRDGLCVEYLVANSANTPDESVV